MAPKQLCFAPFLIIILIIIIIIIILSFFRQSFSDTFLGDALIKLYETL
jgi:hypothetical protein